MSFVDTATTLIRDNAQWTPLIVGGLAFGESLAVIGLFIPAIAVIMFVGGLIGTGIVDPVPVIAAAILGSVLGDWVSYWVGRQIGPSIYYRRPLAGHRQLVARARLLFRRFGLVSVFFGRFLGPIRATIPVVAGVMRMDQRRFQTANVASAIVWVPGLFAPGYLTTTALAGLGISEEARWAIIAGVIALACAAGSWIGYRVLKANARRMAERRARTQRA